MDELLDIVSRMAPEAARSQSDRSVRTGALSRQGRLTERGEIQIGFLYIAFCTPGT